MKQNAITKEMLFSQIESYIKNEDSLKAIHKAYDYAESKHANQTRKSGEPYFAHLLNVAYELSKMQVGPQTIQAGLLHDVIEDCGVSEKEFIDEFGDNVYNLVEAVTKLDKLEFKSEKEYQAANHRKIFIAMAKDVRVILIKLCDRLHNMRTLEYMNEESQKRIASETLNVYAPIAHRLGLAELKNELEDISFFYLDNEKYHEIATLVENKKSERDKQIAEMMDNISKVLEEHNIPYRIFGRSKHLYSINKKMVTKNKRFDEILDLLAIRIITKTELNCYEILGYIHAAYRPIPGRLKDYIAMPKMNMYQSLHTTIVGPEGRIYEVQIRTEEMDSIAEKGVAAHWSYKEGHYDSKKEQDEIVKELAWLKAFEDGSNNEDDASEYMDTVTVDIFNANVYVMTPMGRVIDLPAGSTPIDFAYRIHTEIGNTTVGALVNGVLVPLNTALKTGDVVELKTNKSASPSEDWLKFVRTNSAKNKIKSYFLKKDEQRKEEFVKQGEQMLKDEMKKRGVDPEEYLDKSKLESIYSYFKLSSYTEFMYAIACKSLSPISAIERLVKLGKRELDVEEIQTRVQKNVNKRNNEVSKSGVIVKGVSSMKITLAPCCCPCYGDDIVGYVSRGQGVKVHRTDCPNIQKAPARVIDVQWDENKNNNTKYEVSIKIFSKDRSYLLTDLVTCISQYKANLTSVNIVANPETLTATASMSMLVDDNEHIEMIMANLRKVESVISVERSFK